MRFKKKTSGSESYYKLLDGSIVSTNEGAQAAYYLPVDFFEYAKMKEILIIDNNITNHRQNDTGPFILDSEYIFRLGNSICWMLDIENSTNHKIVIYKNKHNKIILYKEVFRKLSKDFGEGYKWFLELYKKNICGNNLILDVDENQKILTLDIEFSSLIQEDNMEKIERTEKVSNNKHIEKPYNRIFFGAPGTGKSYLLNKEVKEYFGDNMERVTFYPSYTYGGFVGAYKPFPSKDKNGDKSIVYKYIEGPFIRQILNAILNPNENFVLVIEEINRANVSLVFGDIFQLLDRDSNGESEYYINCSEELRLFFAGKLLNITGEISYINDILGENYEKIKIPSNLYIWATMNSCDQGVMPLDTAFKRRWDFEYIDIDWGVTPDFEQYRINLGTYEESWNNVRKSINSLLAKCHIPEDKMLGAYFISKNILNTLDNKKITEVFINKVLMYLYDDIGKQHKYKIFEEMYCPTFSKLCENFRNENIGIKVFKNGLGIIKLDINE